MSLANRLAKIAGKLMAPVRAGEQTLAISRLGQGQRIGVNAVRFTHGGPIPDQYVGRDATAPELSWESPPEGTREFGLLCEDHDAPFPKPFTHWLVYGIPPSTNAFVEEAQAEWAAGVRGTHGRNSTGKIGFIGPTPPPGHGVHHYHFQVFALDAPLDLAPGSDRDDVVAAMQGHVLACGEVVGTYEAR